LYRVGARRASADARSARLMDRGEGEEGGDERPSSCRAACGFSCGISRAAAKVAAKFRRLRAAIKRPDNCPRNSPQPPALRIGRPPRLSALLKVRIRFRGLSRCSRDRSFKSVSLSLSRFVVVSSARAICRLHLTGRFREEAEEARTARSNISRDAMSSNNET